MLAVTMVLLAVASSALADPADTGEAADEGVAAEDTVEDPQPPTRVEEIVVTGSKTEQAEWDSTVPIEVITREEIEALATVDIENVLRQIPGIYVRRNEQFGLGASTIRMQGADPNKVAILQNGRRFRGGIDGVVDLRDIPVSNIQRIEILRGPASSLYGSDAMAGVVNIITREGGPEPVAEAAAAWGSFGHQFYSLAHGWQVGPVRYFLTGLHDEFRLAEQFGDISAQFEDPEDKQKRDQATLRLDFDLGADHSFTLEPSWFQERNPQSNNQNVVTSSEWRWQIADETRLATWFNSYFFDRKNDLEGFEEDNAYRDFEGESRLMHDLPAWRIWEANLLTAGVRARQQTLDQKALEVQTRTGSVTQPAVDASIWQVSPFLQTDVTFGPRWKLLLGSSFDVNERSGLAVNPRGTASYWPWEELKISGTIGRGFRSPDLLQLYGIDVNLGGTYAVLGNADLEPERSTGYQFEVEWRLPAVTGFVSYFRQDFEDLIVTPLAVICTGPNQPPGCIDNPVPGVGLVFQQQNLSAATTQGVELGLELSLLDLLDVQTPYDLLGSVGYAYVHSENENGIPGEDGNDLPFRPRNRVVPGLTLRRLDWGSSLAFWAEYEDDAFTDVANTEESIARNHWLFHMRFQIEPFRTLPFDPPGVLGQALEIGRHLGFFAQGDNLLDTEFGTLAPDGQLAGPRAWLFGVSARY